MRLSYSIPTDIESMTVNIAGNPENYKVFDISSHLSLEDMDLGSNPPYLSYSTNEQTYEEGTGLSKVDTKVILINKKGVKFTVNGCDLTSYPKRVDIETNHNNDLLLCLRDGKESFHSTVKLTGGIAVYSEEGRVRVLYNC